MVAALFDVKLALPSSSVFLSKAVFLVKQAHDSQIAQLLLPRWWLECKFNFNIYHKVRYQTQSASSASHYEATVIASPITFLLQRYISRHTESLIRHGIATARRSVRVDLDRED